MSVEGFSKIKSLVLSQQIHSYFRPNSRRIDKGAIPLSVLFSN